MKLELFVNFDGNCREAVEFYAEVFQSEVGNLMTYGDAPSSPDYLVVEADRERIMYAGVPIGDMTVMFMDMPSGTPLIVGNNINPTVNVGSKEEVARIFDALKVGGEVHMEPQETFFNEWYCMVKDKFDIVWHILLFED